MCDSSDANILASVCPDIRLIVYRYIFDYKYNKLRKQYVSKWLCTPPLNIHRIFWSDRETSFMCYVKRNSLLRVANYRFVVDDEIDDIYNMYDYSDNIGKPTGILSPNYRYSKPK